jgi:ketosteroid isomerase-like protein
MANGLKAQAASYQSKDHALNKNRESWLALFTDDAVVMDPVGESPLDPSGLGHRGKAAIAAFFDKVIANANMDFVVDKSIPAGDQCANMVTVTHHLPNGKTLPMDMIVVYTANDEGLLVSLQAYWEFDKLTERMMAALAE